MAWWQLCLGFPKNKTEGWLKQVHINVKASQNPTGESEYFSMSAFCMLWNGKKRWDKFASKYLWDRALQNHYINRAGWCVCLGRDGKEYNKTSAQETGFFTFYAVFIYRQNKQTSGPSAIKSQLHFWDYLWQSWKSYQLACAHRSKIGIISDQSKM